MFSPLTHDDPHQLGVYRLIARLGSGGMGTVYLARSALGRTVALKTMHARIATDPAFRTRFRLEVDAARVIGPLHGAQVFDADPLAQTPWLATQYVLGPPLDDAIALSGPLPEPAVRALGALLCAALSQLHRSDVVHRDLKPSNIMISADGPKVIDFGIARAMGDDRLTRTGAAAGTPAFMSPEQATGEEHTPAGDVFALAGVLTYAATGHGPFGSGQPADLLYRVRYADADLTGASPSLAALLARCLSKAPADRPTTTELAAQLSASTTGFAHHLPQALLTDIARRAAEVWRVRPYRLPPPADTSPEPPTVPVSPAISRRKLLTVGGGSVLGVAAAGAGTWTWFGRQGSGEGNGKATRGSQTPSASAAPKWDLLWQVQLSPDVLLHGMPLTPLILGDLVAVSDGMGSMRAIDARSGKVTWEPFGKNRTHEVVTDGKQLYFPTAPMSDNEPLAITAAGPSSGDLEPPVARLKEFNEDIYENQLLCVADGVLYLAAGQGKGSEDYPGFTGDQSWFLLAVDVRAGKERWRQPLPRRPDKSTRLHFLAGQVVGNRLVLMQETNDGKVRIQVRDTRTGKLHWDQPLAVSEPDTLKGRLTVDDRYIFPSAGPLRALRLSDGGEAWNAGDDRSGRTGPPMVKNNVVYAVEEGVGVVAVDAATGKLRWAEKGGKGAGADLATPPVIGTRYVYSRSAAQLRAIDIRTGTATQSYKAAGDRFFAHASAGRIIAVGEAFVAAYPLQ
ncbi:protein kinase domain-containing protein [Streptomyces lunaelactis]|uniref:serine/threonine-protein kinase n=1 Tax=Streptomyces lunaelactis TaxID=1535768 RepID=UPI001584BD3E|nr:serine/threonine-protein kinase [Streptomyces lunaelactis]NUK25135.1 serine/threonine-protein kinase [Streptomyces lunaelactis]